MAPLTHLIVSLKRSEIAARSPTSQSSLSLGATVGIAIGIGLVFSFALVTFVFYLAFRRKQRMTPRVRREAWNAMDSGVYSATAYAPRTGFGRVLSVFSSKRRQPTGASHTPPSHDDLPQVQARPRQFPDKESVELQRGYVDDHRASFGVEHTRQPSPFTDAQRQPDAHGSVPPYNSVVRSEQDGDMSGPYRPENDPMPSSIRSLEVNNMAISTDAPKAAWHRKRTGPPPALTIEPPGMHSRSPSDAYSAHSTYATNHSAFTYGSINVPEVPSLPSHLPSDHHYGTQFASYDGSHPIPSPLSQQFPPSPQTPGSIPSVSRSDSGAAEESFPLAPPTPTYSQTHQRIPDDANFECLGPLPANLPPPHFRTAHQQPQQQQDPFLTPRERTPENRSSITDSNSSTTSLPTTTSDATRLGYAQDPLLHATSPFRPHHHSPVLSTFAEREPRSAISTTTSSSSDLNTTTTTADFFPRRRRDSTDSLGSNFTVEEEARIQAQIVKNLAALDKERVMGKGDIVHIPQISERRYSWEE